jgi:hypothetical protein
MSTVEMPRAAGAAKGGPSFSLSISTFPESLQPLLRECDDGGDGKLDLDELTEAGGFFAAFKTRMHALNPTSSLLLLIHRLLLLLLLHLLLHLLLLRAFVHRAFRLLDPPNVGRTKKLCRKSSTFNLGSTLQRGF